MAATTALQSPLSQAIDEFLDDMKARDRKSRFYEEVLTTRSVLALKEDQDGVKHCTNELEGFIKELEEKKSASKTLRSLRTLNPFVKGLKSLMEACSSLVQASPFAVGVVFNGARFVLDLAQKTGETLDAVCNAMDKIGTYLRCYEKFSVAYDTDEEVRETLVASYKKIVEFWGKASKILDDHAFKSAFKNLFGFLTDTIKGTLEGLKEDCDLVQAISSAEEARRMHGDRERVKEEEEKKLEDGIVDWIRARDDLDIRGDFQMHSERRHAKTCSWIFEDERFQRWRDDPSENVLWYHAPPGSGKTVLSSAVIKHLTDRCVPAAYFFYSFSDHSKKKATAGPRALALQLLNILKTGPPDRVVELYKDEMAQHVRYMRHKQHAIEVLCQLLKGCNVYLIVDGLDECLEDKEMRDIMKMIVSATGYGTTKWFFTSRKDMEIQQMMEGLNATEISPSPETLSAEIKLFLADGLKHISWAADQIDTYMEYSEASFLYAKLMLDVLCGDGVTCDDEIKQALNEFPRGLTEYYVRSLLKLCSKSEKQQLLVKRIFTILVFAMKTITWNELCNALAIQRGLPDHSKGREPHEDTIHSLLGSLLIFDRSSSGHDNNPKVKLCHKTIYDFLLQDPEHLLTDRSLRDLDQGDLDRIKYFFVNEQDAFLQIGRDCLTLLQYRRYESLANAKATVNDEDDRENGFLKYAAAFWFVHYIDANHHSQEDFEDVQRFLQSPNFWVCVAVQSRFVPYLFGRFAESAKGCYNMGLRQSYLGQGDSFGVPLPIWLHKYPYGLELDMDFCSFVSDWHEVLASRPDTLDLCVPLSTMNSKLGGGHFPQSERVRVWIAKNKLDLDNVSILRLNRIFLSQGKLFAELIYSCHGEPPGLFHYQRVSIFSKSSKFQGSFTASPSITDVDWRETDFTIQDLTPKVRMVEFIDGPAPHIKRTVDGNIETFKAPTSWLDIRSNEQWRAKWSKSQVTPSGKVVFLHVSKTFIKQECVERVSRDDDSGFESDSSSDSGSDSGSIFDSDSCSDLESDTRSNSNYSPGFEKVHTDEGKGSRKLATDWIIVAHESSEPLWIELGSLDKRYSAEIPLAAHPSLPIVVASQADGQAITVNTDTGNWHVIQYPATLENDNTVLLHQQIHFSPCAQFLHCLTASFTEQSDYSECKLSLSTFCFSENEGQVNLQKSPNPAQQITYQFLERLESLPSYLILAYWGENDVVVALPPLTCEPKLVKFNIPQVSNTGNERVVQTLQDPVFFPSSTLASRPTLLYRHRSSKEHELFLSLVRNEASRTRPDDGQKWDKEQQGPVEPSFPVVMRWKIPHGGGWRPWDPTSDEKSKDMSSGGDYFRILRGGFVDGDRTFDVPIRSGLDWTRKAFLSCA